MFKSKKLFNRYRSFFIIVAILVFSSAISLTCHAANPGNLNQNGQIDIEDFNNISDSDSLKVIYGFFE